MDTTKLTVEPWATDVPAAGDWEITLPDGMLELEAVVIAPSVSRAALIASVAAACVLPAKLGTLINAGAANTNSGVDAVAVLPSVSVTVTAGL